MGQQWGHADDISGARVPPTNEHSPSRAACTGWGRASNQSREFRVLEDAKRAKFAIADGQSIIAPNDAIRSLVQLDHTPIALSGRKRSVM